MKIADLQCQIKIPFYICDHFFFWEWKLHEGIGGEFYTNFRSWEKNKTFLISFNHWEGTAVIWADMTKVWQIFFSCAKSEGAQIIYWAREYKEIFPHKNVGEYPQVWVTGGHDVLETAE